MRKLLIITLLAGLTTLPGYAQIVNIEEQRFSKTNDSTYWYGNLRASANFIKITSVTSSVNISGKIQYKNRPNSIILIASNNFLRSGESDIIRRMFGHLRYNYLNDSRWTPEVFLQWQTDPIRLLRERYLVGAGARIRAFETEDRRQKAFVGLAGMWEQNHFTEEPRINAWYRLSSYATLTLRFGQRNALIATTYFQPIVTEPENYRFSTDWLLKFGITKNLDLTIDYNWSVDKNLPDPATQSVYSWRNGLMFHF